MRVGTGLLKPKNSVLGYDVAGRVEAVGKNVKKLQPGDEVFGWCDGSFAEYTCADENNFAPKPANLTFEQAAGIPMAGLTALQGLRDQGNLSSGQNVLIIGASGGIGTFAVQIAKSFGAEVTGVCSGAERGDGPIDRRRPCHRLLPGRFHPKWAPVRSHPGYSRDAYAVRLQARAKSPGDLRPGGGAGAAGRKISSSIPSSR